MTAIHLPENILGGRAGGPGGRRPPCLLELLFRKRGPVVGGDSFHPFDLLVDFFEVNARERRDRSEHELAGVGDLEARDSFLKSGQLARFNAKSFAGASGGQTTVEQAMNPVLCLEFFSKSTQRFTGWC